MKRNKKGFTLIELLVVIGIIAVLAGVVVVALNPLERIKESRDSKRLQDIQAVRQAVDIALADSEVTLGGDATTHATGNSKTDGVTIASGWVKVTTVTGATGFAKYMPLLPQDPQGATTGESGYAWESDGTDYVLSTSFETNKYDTAYAATDGGPDDTLYETGTKTGLAW